jgi:hypothetical protein
LCSDKLLSCAASDQQRSIGQFAARFAAKFVLQKFKKSRGNLRQTTFWFSTTFCRDFAMTFAATVPQKFNTFCRDIFQEYYREI